MHCTTLKALHGFQKKRAHKSREIKCFLQNVQNEIFKISKMFKNIINFTRAACWINLKISSRDKSTTLIIFSFCHYCWPLLWSYYWKPLKSDSSKKNFISFNESPLKMMKNAFYLILKTLLVFKFLCWLFRHVKNQLD